MKYLDEYRDERLANKLVQEIERCLTRAWTIMEVCGGQTHSIVKHGIDYLLPKGVELVHGPGCPVCVTPLEMIDKAHAIASHPEVIFCSFGDMLRVPGSRTDLFRLKSHGADVRIVYSLLDCLRIAQSDPERQVVFFAIGFETTAPANAMTVHQARQLGIHNLSLLVSDVRVPRRSRPSCSLRRTGCRASWAPVMSARSWDTKSIRPSAAYKVPIVITGFEPLDILEGVFRVVRQLAEGRAEVENRYSRVVTPNGNPAAHQIIWHVFEVCDQKWRGVGPIPQSGYKLQPEFEGYDAARVFAVEEIVTEEPAICISGQILKRLKKPHECPAFGRQCTPQHPLGATMVSAEGACAAYYNYGRHLGVEPAGSQP